MMPDRFASTFSSNPISSTRDDSLLEVAALAHQLLSPISAAHNYAQAMSDLLAQGRLDPEKTADGLVKILRQTQQAQKVGTALKTLFRSQKIQPKTVDLTSLLELAWQRVTRDFCISSHDLILETSSPSLAWCDPTLIEEVFYNLLSNAAKAKQSLLDRSCIRAKIATTSHCIHVCLQNETAAPNTAFGIMTAQQTTSTFSKGCGIGLILVNRILCLHKTALNIAIQNHMISVSFRLPVNKNTSENDVSMND